MPEVINAVENGTILELDALRRRVDELEQRVHRLEEDQRRAEQTLRELNAVLA
jgi:polyhydroxyalkanoate synthesis regulator phasin